MLGTGIAYFIWFNIIGRLSTAMASLGALINPVVGVLGAMIILGDRPTIFFSFFFFPPPPPNHKFFPLRIPFK